MVPVLKSGPTWWTDSRGAEEDCEVWPHKKSAMCCGIPCFFCSLHMCYSFLLSTVNLSEQVPAGKTTRNLVLVLYFLALPLFKDCIINQEMFWVLGFSLFFSHPVCYLSCKSILKNHRIPWIGTTTVIKSNFWWVLGFFMLEISECFMYFSIYRRI